MKRIIKGREPNSFVEHRVQLHSDFDNMPANTKEELRRSLLTEQGYICCYCMKRIPEKNGMKIEHYRCQDNYKKMQLNYTNLLGACLGNKGQPWRLTTCDTHKDNDDLTIDPLSNNPDCGTLIKYSADGKIYCDNSTINKDLNNTLNLNTQTLKDVRSAIYESVQQRVEAEGRKYRNKKVKLRFFAKEKEKWLTKSGGEFAPFCMVAVYYLNKKIRQNK